MSVSLTSEMAAGGSWVPRRDSDDFLETLLHWHHGTTCLLRFIHHHYIILFFLTTSLPRSTICAQDVAIIKY